MTTITIPELADLAMIAYWDDSIAEYNRRGYDRAFAIHPQGSIDETYALIDDRKNTLTIVFLGTNDPYDWAWRNLAAAPEYSHTLGIKVHRPLWAGCKAIIPQIKLILQTREFSGFYIIGHSKGGAMAHLTGLYFQAFRPAVVSFGAPRCFSRDSTVKLLNHHRVAHCGDPVPRIPPRNCGWSHFGKSIIIDSDWNVNDLPGAWIRAIESMGTLELITQNFGKLIDNHKAYSKL